MLPCFVRVTVHVGLHKHTVCVVFVYAPQQYAHAGQEVPVAELGIGNTVLVRPGERVPADGTVTLGVSVADESMLTGMQAYMLHRPRMLS